MTHLLLLTAFVLIFAYLQSRRSRKIAYYNGRCQTQNARKDKGTYMTVALLVMMFLAMFRGINVGNDTEEYHKIFINIITNPDYANTTRYEIGYVFLNKLVGKFTSESQAIIIVTSAIVYLIYIWFLRRHSGNYALSLIFFFLFVFGASLTMIRQELAIAFLLIAYDRCVNKRIIASYIWIVIAALFHSSAIIFLVMPLLPYLRFDKSVAVFVAGVVTVLTATNLLFRIFDVIAPQYSHYFGGKYSGTGFLAITYQLIRNFVFFCLIFYVVSKTQDNSVAGKSLLKSNQKSNMVGWIVFVSAAGLIFGYRINLIDRIITYFNTFYIIFLPNALNKYAKKTALLLKTAIVGIMIAYTIVTHIFRPEWNTIYPYEFFWQD